MDQEKIGKLIAKLRKSKGLTQSELGEMVGVGFRAVSKWENGITSPDISIINDLSKILGISADELLQGKINDNKEISNNKFNYKRLLYLTTILLISILVIVIINVNIKRVEIYKLAPVDSSSYYIEGEIIFKSNFMTINITKLNFEKQNINKKLIKNYQYELLSNKKLIWGYGNVKFDKSLPRPITIEEWCNGLNISYESKLIVTKKQLINNNLNLKITFIDNENNELKKDIKIKLIGSNNK